MSPTTSTIAVAQEECIDCTDLNPARSLLWLPIHHTQLHICISNPEGVKVPQFVILFKQQPVYRRLILSSLKLQGAWMGATLPRFSVMNSIFKQHMTKPDGNNKWSEMRCTFTACTCLPARLFLHLIKAIMNAHAQNVALYHFPGATEATFVPNSDRVFTATRLVPAWEICESVCVAHWIY